MRNRTKLHSYPTSLYVRNQLSCISFLLLNLAARINAEEGGSNIDWDWNWDWETWKGLVRYLLAAFFVIFGLHMLLYAPLSCFMLMREYINKGVAIAGDVISCEEARVSNSKFEVAVLYTAPVHKFSDTRGRFRHPDAMEHKRFMRRFNIDHAIPRGTTVEVLMLNGHPRSGCLREVVERNIEMHSHLRAVLLLTPGLCLLSLVLWLATQEIQAMGGGRAAWSVFAVSLSLILIFARMWSDKAFQKQKTKRFNSAVAMKVSNQQQNTPLAKPQGKSEPLLPNPV